MTEQQKNRSARQRMAMPCACGSDGMRHTYPCPRVCSCPQGPRDHLTRQTCWDEETSDA